MKDLLILLCIGVIAVLLFHERSQWMSSRPGLVTPAPETHPSPLPTEETGGDTPPPAAPSFPPASEAFAKLVAQSQRTALSKYPALGVPDSEINIRFTYRYKNLLATRSPRLQDPAWPVQLADECARDSGARAGSKPSTVSSRRAAALPMDVPAPAGTPVPSLRVPPPDTAAQTLVFHPAASAPTTSAPTKPSDRLPFVTLDAVNQSSGNNYTYNFNSYWWYDISFRQSVGIAIKVRNMGRAAAAVKLRWLFFARRTSDSNRFVFGATDRELDLAPGQAVDVPAASPMLQSREVTDYWVGGARYLSGSKYEGWLVQLFDRDSRRIIKQTGSTSYLEDLAQKTDISLLVDDFKKGHTQLNPGL